MNREFLRSSGKFFLYYKSLGEKAIAQLEPDQLFLEPNAGTNSIAIVVQHLVGNMHSRWSGFPDQDGERANRNRDAEFELFIQSKAQLLEHWESGWAVLFAALERLEGVDLWQSVQIRGERISILEAIHRQLAHYAYHVGQMVLLAKIWRGEEWQSLSIARGASQQFNQAMQQKNSP